MKDIEVKLIEKIITYQGEGFDSGERMLLVRMKQCDRVLAKKPCPWCDTIKKMQTSKEESYSLYEIQNELYQNYAGLLISGGEPTLDYHKQDTLKMLTYLDYRFANVETNGYDIVNLIKEAPDYKNIRYIISPKIFNHDDFQKAFYIVEHIGLLQNVLFKMVIEKEMSELNKKFLNLLKAKKYNSRVYLMPEGKTRDEIINNTKNCLFFCDFYKFNFSSRLHILHDFT